MNPRPLIQKYISLSDTRHILSGDQQFQDINIQRANQLHKNGKLEEAKVIYDSIFNSNAEQFEVLHLLGTLEAQLGNFTKAIDLLGTSMPTRAFPGMGASILKGCAAKASAKSLWSVTIFAILTPWAGRKVY
mgnify:CR=1 FL=1